MPAGRFVVLLNDALMGRLLAMDARARARLREKLEFLENGFWDAGVRVKKLRGTAGRVVFEARLDRGDRLLFTLGPLGGSRRDRTAVYVWGLVSHDDISQAASRIVPANAPFLDFAPLEEEERAELAIESLPVSWKNQENVEERIPDDYGPQRWLVLDEEEWRRILASPDPSGLELRLLLTREQEALLAAPPPVLISGTAGSGKTTLAAYYLLRGAGVGSRRLFLTCNPLLRESARRTWEGLAMNRDPTDAPPVPRFAVLRELLRELVPGAEAKFPPDREAGLAEFTQIFADHADRRKYDPELVWEEIRSIVKGARLPLSPARLAGLTARFVARQASAAERAELREHLLGLQGLPLAARAETFMAERTRLAGWTGLLAAVEGGSPDSEGEVARSLDEVARLVAKASADWSSPLLSLEEYLALGRKRAPLFAWDRRAIHRIAEYYQDRLARSGRWDEIDLSRAALRRMDGRPEEFSWDLVVCDEVQDLTDVQLSLLFRLAGDPRAVILAGDTRQTINPSGFRWEEAKNRFFERGIPAPAVHRLTLNFRSAGSIVRLSNALLDIKAALLGLTDTEMREHWKYAGRPPLVLEGMGEQAILGGIDLGGAGQAVLVRSAAERDRLKAALSSHRVFTIAEAKGLEFDSVFLWRYCADPQAAGLWQSLAAGRGVEPERAPHLRHELALLYVAVTRARATLVAWDGEAASPLWDIAEVAPLVTRSSEEGAFAERWRAVSSPAEWGAQGEYYLARGHHGAAAECFRHAGNDSRFALASALEREAHGEHAAAAPLFEAAGELWQAAKSRERSGDWAGARRLWRLMGEETRQRKCAARVHEQAGSFGKAAREWEAAGDQARAADCWEKAGAWEKAARAHAAVGEHLRAAALFEKARLPREAADSLEKAGRYEQAADLHARAGEAAAAARLYEAAGSDEKLVESLRAAGDEMALAARLEARGDARGAREAYARLAARSAADREALEASIPQASDTASALTAGLRLSALGSAVKAGRLLLRAGQFALAAEDFERAGTWDDVSLCREQLGQFAAAARALEKSGPLDRESARRLHGLLHAHLTREASDPARAAQELYDEALAMKADGRHVPAVVRLRLLQDAENTVALLRGLGWHGETLRFLLDAGDTAGARAYCESGDVSLPAAEAQRLVEEYAAQADTHTVALLARLLAAPGGGGVGRAAAVERLVEAALARGIGVEDFPAGLLALVTAEAAAGAAMRILRAGLPRGKPVSERMRAFAAEVGRAARRAGDPAMAEAASWAAARVGRQRADERPNGVIIEGQ